MRLYGILFPVILLTISLTAEGSAIPIATPQIGKRFSINETVPKFCCHKVYSEKILLTENVIFIPLIFRSKKIATVQVKGRESVVCIFSVEQKHELAG
jgi:hypothetical protein